MSFFRITRLATFAAMALALVVTGAVAGAAGQALILGQANSAGTSSTSLSASTSGSALRVDQNGTGTSLKAMSEHTAPLTLDGPVNQPPMTINSSAKVTNLNADRLDGRNSTSFMPRATYRTAEVDVTIAAGDTETVTLPCDAGDVALSSGYSDKGRHTNLTDSYSYPTGEWVHVFRNHGTASDTVWTSVLCADFAPLHPTH